MAEQHERKKGDSADFKELDDRMIAETPKGPFLSIKTNLDPDGPLDENPYAKNLEPADRKKFEDFFNGK